MQGLDAAGAAAVVDRIDEALRNSEGTFRSPRMTEADDTGAVAGEVRWQPAKSLWILGMTLAALIGLVWNAKTPETLPHRPNLVALQPPSPKVAPWGQTLRI